MFIYQLAIPHSHKQRQKHQHHRCLPDDDDNDDVDNDDRVHTFKRRNSYRNFAVGQLGIFQLEHNFSINDSQRALWPKNNLAKLRNSRSGARSEPLLLKVLSSTRLAEQLDLKCMGQSTRRSVYVFHISAILIVQLTNLQHLPPPYLSPFGQR